MLAQERQNTILAMLNDKRTVQVSELTSRFGASVATIRRDLEALENQGLARRVYGGAVSDTPARIQPLFRERKDTNAAVKQAIGRAAADLIRENETIFLDIGTTTFEVARQLKRYRNLTVLTNSLPILNELVDTDLAVFSLGGKMRGAELCFSGDIAMSNLQSFYVDKAIVGTGGITLEQGISDFNHGNAQLRRMIMERSRETIVVTDSSKFGVNAFAIVGDIAKINTIVTDTRIPADYADNLRGLQVKVVVAE